jgi:acyl dehydratase
MPAEDTVMFATTTTGMRYYEDVVIGQPMTFGALPVSRADIMTFARAYDPQPIHLDDAAAKQSIVGGLCASGFHTGCLMMRLMCDHYLNTTASLGAPGLDEVKWLQPLRPDDVVSVRAIADTKRVLASRPSVGMAHVQFEVLNQHGVVIMTSSCNQMLQVRNPGPATAEPGQRTAHPAGLNLWDHGEAEPWIDVKADTPSPYFEDCSVGDTRELGHHTFGRDEIIAFAKLYDPQPFHLDEAAGKASLFGGLAASGWHTACQFVRLVVAYRQRQERASRDQGLPVPVYGPSPGIKNLRWIKPVMVGDRLEYRHRTIGKVELKSRPDRGLLQLASQARNQHGDIVFDYQGALFVERRLVG